MRRMRCCKHHYNKRNEEEFANLKAVATKLKRRFNQSTESADGGGKKRKKKAKHKQNSITATQLGVYPFNADICISNTDISFNKYRSLSVSLCVCACVF